MNDSHAMALSQDQLIYAITVCLHDSHGMAIYIYICIYIHRCLSKKTLELYAACILREGCWVQYGKMFVEKAVDIKFSPYDCENPMCVFSKACLVFLKDLLKSQ